MTPCSATSDGEYVYYVHSFMPGTARRHSAASRYGNVDVTGVVRRETSTAPSSTRRNGDTDCGCCGPAEP
ncbi:MAG: hypothetical protein ACLTYN_05030 [Dysosmobacter welbionis]